MSPLFLIPHDLYFYILLRLSHYLSHNNANHNNVQLALYIYIYVFRHQRPKCDTDSNCNATKDVLHLKKGTTSCLS